ncbi:hypothetical protein D5O23_24770 [Salmonella enterica subsp. enterica]|nr:hypothetical protein [Salmonella enterica subsp. enterica serovar Mokola]
MCHSFLIVYYWNDTEFLTLPNKVLCRLLSFSLLLCIRQHWLPDGCTIISYSFRFSGSDVSHFFYLHYHLLTG